MATLGFYAGEDTTILHLQGSGLGFFGSAGAGDSVLVGEWQDQTFITNAAGTVFSSQCDNLKFPGHLASSMVNGAGPVALTGIPNQRATLNIRFEHTSAIQVQNARARIYDRTTTTRAASGVHCRFFELRNHSAGDTTVPTTTKGSGDTLWKNGSITGWQTDVLSLATNPGYSGVMAAVGNSGNTSHRHDWFLGISASPESIGSKTEFGLYVNLEYL